MKKITLVLFTIVNLSLQAQTKVSLTGGVNINNINFKDKDANQTISDSADYAFGSTKSEQGFHVGFLANLPFTDNWNIETGVLLIKKGVTTKESTTLQPSNVSFGRTQTISANYMQIPLYLSFFPNSRKKYKLTAALGGYISFGVTGQYKSNSNIGSLANIRSERELKFGNASSDDLQKIEYGIGAKAGFVMSDNLVLGVGLQQSVVNNAPENRQQYGTILHNNITFSISKIFRK